jgi:hypothetical protein
MSNKKYDSEAKIYWVKKLVKSSEWSSYYSQISSYCFLGKDINGVWIGFLVADKIPFSCVEITDPIELKRIRDYRKERNIAPLPFEIEEIESKKIIDEEDIIDKENDIDVKELFKKDDNNDDNLWDNVNPDEAF